MGEPSKYQIFIISNPNHCVHNNLYLCVQKFKDSSLVNCDQIVAPFQSFFLISFLSRADLLVFGQNDLHVTFPNHFAIHPSKCHLTPSIFLHQMWYFINIIQQKFNHPIKLIIFIRR